MLDKEKLIKWIDNKIKWIETAFDDQDVDVDILDDVISEFRELKNIINDGNLDIKLSDNEFINIFQECEKCHKLVGNTYITKFLNIKTIAVYHFECWDENHIKDYEEKLLKEIDNALFKSSYNDNLITDHGFGIKLKQKIINGDFR